MKQKLLPLIFILIATLSLPACSNTEKQSYADNSNTNTFEDALLSEKWMALFCGSEFTYTFNKDGTGFFTSDLFNKDFTYRIEDKTLFINEGENELIYTISIQDGLYQIIREGNNLENFILIPEKDFCKKYDETDKLKAKVIWDIECHFGLFYSDLRATDVSIGRIISSDNIYTVYGKVTCSDKYGDKYSGKFDIQYEFDGKKFTSLGLPNIE